MCDKIYYIKSCRVTEVNGQKKYRNFLCIGPIESLSFATIKNLNSVSIYAHKIKRNIHILLFRNAVRIENKQLWGNNFVISIRKQIPPNFFIQLHLEVNVAQEEREIVELLKIKKKLLKEILQLQIEIEILQTVLL